MFKKLFTTMLIAVMAVGLAPALARAEEPRAVTVLLDGLPLRFTDASPRIVGSRTMVPFRAIAEALGVEVTWHQESWSIEAIGPDGTDVRLFIDQKRMTVDGKPVELDVAPFIDNGRTLIPLRAFSEAFKADVDWHQESWTATIESPVREMRTLAFYALRSYPEVAYVPRFSDVAFGWASLLSDGTVTTEGAEFQWPEPDGDTTGEKLLEEARKAGTKRHLMVHATDLRGGGDVDIRSIVLRDDLIAKVAGEIKRIVTEKQFDGVNLDLEYLGLGESGIDLALVRHGYVKLVRTVATEMRALGKETIVSVHALNSWYPGYDYAALANEADLLQVMAHDYRQDDNPEPADQVEEAIKLALAQVDRSKLLLGLNLPVETAETVWQKAGLAKRYNLAGVSVWRLGEIRPERMAALESTIQAAK